MSDSKYTEKTLSAEELSTLNLLANELYIEELKLITDGKYKQLIIIDDDGYATGANFTLKSLDRLIELLPKVRELLV